MAKYEFYRKKGNLNYKERIMLDDIAKRLEQNPNLSKDITPAQDFNQLKELHSKITSDIAEVIEEVNNDEIPKQVSSAETKKPYIDPLNRETPIINDYVLDDKFNPFADFEKAQKARGNFAEPTNYDDAFELPDEDDLRSNKKMGSQQGGSKINQRDFSMDNSGGSPVNRRKSKRFAASLVNLTCRLLEVGFVWYATKDINENKLAEYEMTGEIDLSLIVELPDGQEATIRDFFLSQMPEIEKASKVNPESKASLIEALTELFIEKNIQPSAAYEAIIEGVSLLAEQGIKLALIVQQNNAMLNQLRQMQMDKPAPQPVYSTPPPPPTPTYNKDWEREEPEQNINDETFSIAPSSKMKPSDELMIDEEELDEEQKNDLTLLKEIETKE